MLFYKKITTQSYFGRWFYNFEAKNKRKWEQKECKKIFKNVEKRKMLMYNDKIIENKGAKNEENPESLEAVHTHTHIVY